jgi:alpha-glucosidase
MRRFFPLALTLVAFSATFAPLKGEELKGPIEVVSLNGDLRTALKLGSGENSSGQLQYRVWLREQPIVLNSHVVLRFANGETLGDDCEVTGVERREVDSTFQQHPGKRRTVVDRCREATISLRENDGAGTRWQMIVRAYDDGIALRYAIPDQPNWKSFELIDERTEFALPENAVVTALPLASFTTSHENRYETRPVAELPEQQLFGLPLLVEIPDVGWAAILEANLTDHAGMYLAKSAAGDTFVSRLSPRVDNPNLAVRAALPHQSPWRVVLVGNRLEALVDSDTLLKLNEPRAIGDVAWIKPGKTTFPWWNGFFEENVSFSPGLNTATAKHYIEFCAEHGIPYHSLDGMNNVAWYGGPIVPYEGADITQPIDGLDLQEVLAYAKEKGVRIRLWMHWEAARKHMARAFPIYRRWGIEGVMIDFMDRDDQEMVAFQRELLELAAKNKLTVTFHGVAPPTGLERTYPHLLTSEAVMGLEYNKWDADGIAPEHDVTVALTRMLAGPLDYHQGSLRGVPPAEFTARNEAPLVVGTPCRMLASYVVLQNHLPMMADYPTAYRRHPLSRVMASIPATWDDTRTLSADVGEHVAIARRSGDDWWLGAMTNSDAREVEIPLNFLGDGAYQAEIYRDDLAAPDHYARESRTVTSNDTLELPLSSAGGALVHFRRTASADPPGWRLVWSDDFDTFDETKWTRTDSDKPTNNSLHAYLPEQVTVRDGCLVIRSENAPARGLPYRSGQVVSKRADRLGRWEVRAKLPGTRGMWPAIWLLPDGPWPSEGEIDIMENRGNQPSITSSAFHWGTRQPYAHGFRAIEQQTALADKLVDYSDGFHTYAVEWLPDQLRFYVDDVHHTTFYNDEVGYFLPKLTAPMRLMINTAIGGDFLPAPDASTVWPQEFLVDWVRVYESTGSTTGRVFRNGDFEAGGGSLAGWHVFGNRIDGDPNIQAHTAVAKDGRTSLKLAGQGGGENYSGVSQGISVAGGEKLTARLAAFVPKSESLAGTSNRVTMKIEFYNNWGDFFGGPAMLGAEEQLVADADTPVDEWQTHELSAVAPEGAIEARLSLVFIETSTAQCEVYVDAIDFGPGD